MKLNVYLAQSGICSRRKAIDLIARREVTVNNAVAQHPAMTICPSDTVCVRGNPVKRITRHTYILLNKPRGYVTTTHDELNRKTVLHLIPQARHKRLFPVGRLDQDSEGALLLTNDGQYAHKLTHPRYAVSKTYRVIIDSPIASDHLQQLKKGIHLSDGFIQPDRVHADKKKRTLYITLHSGRNRIIRRMLAHFGYQVKKLVRTHIDQFSVAGLPPGSWKQVSPNT